MCDFCQTRLRKHDGYLNVYAYQFKGPIDEMSNAEKDYAISNHGQLPGAKYGYSHAFYGKLLPDKKPGRSINMYELANSTCEPGCFTGDCREYADAMERYFQCREKCPKQDVESVTRVCGKMPINPMHNSGRKNWTHGGAKPYDNRKL